MSLDNKKRDILPRNPPVPIINNRRHIALGLVNKLRTQESSAAKAVKGEPHHLWHKSRKNQRKKEILISGDVFNTFIIIIQKSSIMLQYIIPALLAGHGLAHISGFVASFTSRDMDYRLEKTWMLSGRVYLNRNTGRIFGLLWLIAAFILILSCLNNTPFLMVSRSVDVKQNQ